MHDTKVKSLNVSIKMSEPQIPQLQKVNFYKQNCMYFALIKLPFSILQLLTSTTQSSAFGHY